MKKMVFNDILGCACGHDHSTTLKGAIIGSGAIGELANAIAELGGTKAFVLSDANTYAAAGELACELLNDAGIEYRSYSYSGDVSPDETSVGRCIMHYDSSCDIIVGVGSGVINDIAKILSTVSKRPYIIVGTAPSMDGYASATSSMVRDGLKLSINSRCPDIIIGDTDILKKAPLKMMKSGLGDMLAKYISICEWRIANIVKGEYYCEEIASMIRQALKRCTDNADGLLKRDETAVEAVFEGLMMGGVAMNYAGVSRPASGFEHYISHIWDMRHLEFGTPEEFHGIQCAIGALTAARAYERLKTLTPDRDRALAYAQSFDLDDWNRQLKGFLGRGAESMIALEKKEGKYLPERHAARLDIILDRWDDILRIVDEEVPSAERLAAILDSIDAPKRPEDIGISSDIMPMTFKASKDIRDKYGLPMLLWDLGILDEQAELERSV